MDRLHDNMPTVYSEPTPTPETLVNCIKARLEEGMVKNLGGQVSESKHLLGLQRTSDGTRLKKLLRLERSITSSTYLTLSVPRIVHCNNLPHDSQKPLGLLSLTSGSLHLGKPEPLQTPSCRKGTLKVPTKQVGSGRWWNGT